MMLFDVLSSAQDTLGAFLPRALGAIVLLVGGLVVARLVARALRRLLDAAGLDDHAARTGIGEPLERFGLGTSLTTVLASAVRFGLSALVVVAAISLLGFSALSASLNRAILYLPQIFAAIAIVLVGIVVAAYVRRWVDRVAVQMDLEGPLGIAVELAVLAVFAVTAMAQLSISTAMVRLVIALVIGAAAFTVALAFGLGGRDLARQVTAGRSIAESFEPGQTISVAGVRGRIVSLQRAAALVESDDGRRVRIPNHLLLESIVTVEDAPA
jgi:small-conductance mechanosensitive channel